MSMIRRGARWTGLLFVATVSVVGASCGGGDGPAGPGGGGGPTVTRIDLSPTSANVFVGQTSSFTASPKDADGASVSGKTVSWSSSDESIAKVSGGVVTGVKAGSVAITAAVGSVQAKADVKVLVPVATIALTPSPDTIIIGGTSQLSATLKDASGATITDRVVTWKSSNDLIASVSTAGLVTSKSLGSAEITATVEEKSATTTVVVIPPPVATVSVTPPASSLIVGGTVQLSATTKDANGNPLSGRTVTWTSSDQSIATVSTTGVVTAQALGSATITATSEEKTATATITVTLAPVQTVAVSPSSVSVKPGSTTQLTATLSDATGHALTGRDIAWSTSDASKATISGTGTTVTITGVSYGSVTITATSETKSGSATVKVSDGIAPTLVGLTFLPSSTVDVTTGAQTLTVSAHITDAGGSGVAQFAVNVSAPNGIFFNCVTTTLAAGTPADGTWNCPIQIPAGANPGSWKLFLLVSDVGLSSATYGEAELTAANLPTSFTVVSPTPDAAAPVIQSLQLSPTAVNVSGGAQTITISAHLTDDVSGVSQFDFVGTSPSGQTVGCSDVTPSGDTKLDGTWSCTVSIPATAEAGTWTIYVRATDRTLKFSFLPRTDGFPAGFPTSFTVTR
jgi:trimeric autotransporter adhesin